MEKIKCCPDHPEYLTPLILSFKVPGKEFFCPHCGQFFEFFDRSFYAQYCYILNIRLVLFKAISKDYLSQKTDEYTLFQKPDNEVTSEDA
jgi:hypothetical protein